MKTRNFTLLLIALLAIGSKKWLYVGINQDVMRLLTFYIRHAAPVVVCFLACLH